MSPNLREIYQACNPCQVLDVRRPRDRNYYVDLSDVRGGDPIGDIEAAISLFSPRVPTYHLLSGQVGSGKSVELLRLQSLLESRQFQTVYIEVSRYLDMGDVDVVDAILAIASDFARAMAAWQIEASSPTLESILERAKTFVQPFDREISPSPPTVSHSSLHRLLAECVGRMREYPLQRLQLRQFLDVQLPTLVEAIARDLVEVSTEKLRSRGIEGIVLIVDNLDRLANTSKSWGRLQSEYLFVDRGEWLQKFGCHAIYTVPIGLLFSKEIGSLQARFDTDPIVLPIVPLYRRDGEINPDGLNRLKQIVLRRIFPHVPPEAFDLAEFCQDAAAIEQLCRVSGGHVRNLLRLLHRWIEKERELPLPRSGLQAAIAERRARIAMSLTETDRTLLEQFAHDATTQAQAIPNDFLRSGLMLEYRDEGGSWFALDPIVRHELRRD
ncbi:MAG: ATP-binding protein [Geitlerinemataceae cyanobacterium]